MLAGLDGEVGRVRIFVDGHVQHLRTRQAPCKAGPPPPPSLPLLPSSYIPTCDQTTTVVACLLSQHAANPTPPPPPYASPWENTRRWAHLLLAIIRINEGLVVQDTLDQTLLCRLLLQVVEYCLGPLLVQFVLSREGIRNGCRALPLRISAPRDKSRRCCSHPRPLRLLPQSPRRVECMVIVRYTEHLRCRTLPRRLEAAAARHTVRWSVPTHGVGRAPHRR